MKYTLASPLTVGSLDNPVTIDELELASFSVNFEPYYSDKGNAIISVVLVHRPSDYKINFVFNDAASLGQWNAIKAAGKIEKSIFDRLMQEAKLPAGSVTA